MNWREFIRSMQADGLQLPQTAATNALDQPGDVQAEYRAISEGTAVVDRSYRSVIEVRGRDRAAWLHNLTTNEIKNLGQSEGNYAFATNLQGRILFDLIAVIRGDSILVTLDKGFLPRALQHFNKYIVMEDVTVIDRSDEFVVIGLCGPKAQSLLSQLGIANAGKASQYTALDFTWNANQAVAVRDDFCGPFGLDLLIPTPAATEFLNWLADSAHASDIIPISDEAVQIHRIEAGIPWPGHEITEEFLPAETAQLERAVSFQKGCYLGQEVVERMRSRKVVARQLCGLLMAENDVPPMNCQLVSPEGKPVGVLTSACRTIAARRTIGLGYLKTGFTTPGTTVIATEGQRSMGCSVVPLPHVKV